jgi:hypothetical protein
MAIDPLAIPVGLEGFTIYETGAKDYDLATGLDGFVLAEAEPFPRIPTAFEGFVFSFDPSERFIKVTDFRGRPLSGAVVTAKNLAGDVSDTTGEDGIATVAIQPSGTTEIVILKEKTFRTYSYTFASEDSLITLILQPRILE